MKYFEISYRYGQGKLLKRYAYSRDGAADQVVSLQKDGAIVISILEKSTDLRNLKR